MSLYVAPIRAGVHLRHVVAKNPMFPIAALFLAKALVEAGRPAEAIPPLEGAVAATHGAVPELVLSLAHARAANGDKAAARTTLSSMAKQPTASRFELAAVAVALGDRDTAFRFLHEAIAQRDKWISWIKVDPRFDALRGDPRFADVLRLARF